MALKKFDSFAQGTPAWFEARCGIVTASMIGNLITAKGIERLRITLLPALVLA